MQTSDSRKRQAEAAGFAPICSGDPHHFSWTWPVEGGRGSVGVCSLCGAVTTGERDARIRAEARRELLAEVERRLGDAFRGDAYEENAISAASESEWSWFKFLATETVRGLAEAGEPDAH